MKNNPENKIEKVSASQVLRTVFQMLKADDFPRRKFIKQAILSFIQGAAWSVEPVALGRAINAAGTPAGLRNPEVPLYYGLDRMIDFVGDQLDITINKNDETLATQISDNFAKDAAKMYLDEDPAFRIYNPLPSFQNAAGRAGNAITNLMRNGRWLIESATTMVVSGAILFNLDKRVFAGLLAWGAANTAWSLYQRRKTTMMSEDNNKMRRETQNRALDIASNVSTIQRTANESEYKGKIEKEYDDNKDDTNKILKFFYGNERVRTVMGAVANFAAVAALFLTARETGLQIGDLTAMTSSAERFLWRQNNVVRYLSNIYQNAIQYREAMKILDHTPEILDKADAVELDIADLKKNPPLIEFKNVLFHYKNKDGEAENNILEDFSLVLRGGEQVAIMGDSGSGKTTFLSLLLREYEPQAGEIWIDGHKVDDVSLKTLRTAVRYIPQSDDFLDRSVRENLLLVKPDATDKEIEFALAQAKVMEAVDEHGGLDAPMGSKGGTFSGGQKHRIGLARAFLANAPVMVFDEPTSDLDPKVAKKIIDSIKAATKGKTSVIITHNPVAAAEFDRVIVMREGKIIDDGRPAELAAKQGEYSALLSLHHGRE